MVALGNRSHDNSRVGGVTGRSSILFLTHLQSLVKHFPEMQTRSKQGLTGATQGRFPRTILAARRRSRSARSRWQVRIPGIAKSGSVLLSSSTERSRTTRRTGASFRLRHNGKAEQRGGRGRSQRTGIRCLQGLEKYPDVGQELSRDVFGTTMFGVNYDQNGTYDVDSLFCLTMWIPYFASDRHVSAIQKAFCDVELPRRLFSHS